MVQLKPINGKFTVVSETDFNSMMVQLKQILNYTNSAYAIFQFHDGTIKTQTGILYTAMKHISIP